MRSHDRCGEFDEPIGTGDLADQIGGHVGVVLVVDRDVVADLEIDFDVETVRGGDAFGHASDAVVNRLAGGLTDRADRATDLGNFRDDVVGRPGVQTRDGDDGGIEHTDPTRDQGLQGLHDFTRGRNRIESSVGLTAVTTLAHHADVERVARCHEWSGSGTHEPGGK